MLRSHRTEASAALCPNAPSYNSRIHSTETYIYISEAATSSNAPQALSQVSSHLRYKVSTGSVAHKHWQVQH